MNAYRRITIGTFACALVLAAGLLTSACSSGGSGSTRVHMHYGAGYRGFYRRPWIRGPIYIGDRDVDPDWGVEPPGGLIDMPMPDMGMPDMGGMDMGSMDLGGFDW